MNLCAQCGLKILNGELCWHHHAVYPDDWAASNRRMCDFFHRGVVSSRVPDKHPFMFEFLGRNT